LVGGEDVMTASSLTVASRDRKPTIIDDDHLGRMTLGDHRLEREVLQIFVRQTIIMLGRITGPEPALAAAAAHTLMGSARGIGAWQVARAAERLERAIGEGGEQDVDAAIADLRAATVEARTAIGARLDDPSGDLSRGH
jgi:HPt (histidine-containing phosphotransfer) domain-containing protein